MSTFVATVIEDKVLLAVSLIDAALLALLLLIGIKNTTPAARSYIFASLVIAFLLFLFVQDQLYDYSEPGIETFQTIQQHYS